MSTQARKLPTTGQFMMWVGAILFAGAAAWSLMQGWGEFVSVGSWFSLMAVVSYAAGLRPVVLLSDDELSLRGMASTTRIPIAAVTGVLVQQTLVVSAGGKRYRSPSVGRKWRAVAREAVDRTGNPTSPPLSKPATDVASVVESAIKSAAESQRARLGVDAHSEEVRALGHAVRREWSWPMLGVLAMAVGFVVLSLLV